MFIVDTHHLLHHVILIHTMQGVFIDILIFFNKSNLKQCHLTLHCISTIIILAGIHIHDQNMNFTVSMHHHLDMRN